MFLDNFWLWSDKNPWLGELQSWLWPLFKLVDSVGGDGEEQPGLGKVVERDSWKGWEVEKGDDGVENPVEKNVVGWLLLLTKDLTGEKGLGENQNFILIVSIQFVSSLVR